MDSEVKRAEFEETVDVMARAILGCATAIDAARETLVKAAGELQAFRKLYCRTCKRTFSYREIAKTPGLRVPCPHCGGSLVPAGNIKT